jgi:hypothetical protein
MQPIRATKTKDGYSVECSDGRIVVVSARKAELMVRLATRAQAAYGKMEFLSDRLSHDEMAKLAEQQEQSQFYEAMAKVIMEASDGH